MAIDGDDDVKINGDEDLLQGADKNGVILGTDDRDLITGHGRENND